MDAHEINKFLGAILGALVFAMGLSVLSEIIFEPEELYDPSYVVQIADENQAETDEEKAETPFAVLLAQADPAEGKSVTRVCGACHNFEDGGPNGIGPNLHGVVGRPIASHEGFNYSNALASYGEGKTWTYDELNGFIENPQKDVPGTIMGFAGLKDPEQRAAAISYLKSISPDAPPLPEPPQEVASAEASGTATDATQGGEAPAAAAGGEAPAAGGTPAATEGGAPGGGFAALVDAADPAEGQANAAICLACHSVGEGEPAKIGPNLHGVFGRPIASAEGFNYTDAMKNFATKDGEWTLEHLNTYLTAPMEVVPGTRMAFAGVKDDAQRASIIAWLHSISPDAGPIMETAAVSPAATGGETPAAAPAEPEIEGAVPGHVDNPAEANTQILQQPEAVRPQGETSGEDVVVPPPAGMTNAPDRGTGEVTGQPTAAPEMPAAAETPGAPDVPATPQQPAAAETPAAPAEGSSDQSSAAPAADQAPQQEASAALEAAKGGAGAGAAAATEEPAAAVDAENVTIEPAQKSQVEVVNPHPAN